jgi:hypothetical protein
MVLLCARHHTAHHTGVYRIEIRDGLAWVQVPGWVDPTRPWLRNTTHHDHHATATRLTEQLTDPPSEQQPLPWDTPESGPHDEAA